MGTLPVRSNHMSASGIGSPPGTYAGSFSWQSGMVIPRKRIPCVRREIMRRDISSQPVKKNRDIEGYQIGKIDIAVPYFMRTKRMRFGNGSNKGY